MGKKKGNTFLKYLPIVSAALCVLSVFMMALTFVKVDASSTTISGFAVTFTGATLTEISYLYITTTVTLESSAVLIFIFLVIIVTILLPLSIYLFKGKTLRQIILFGTTLLTLTASICFFVTTSIVTSNLASSMGISNISGATESLKENFSLGIGAILGGSFLMLATLINGYMMFNADKI